MYMYIIERVKILYKYTNCRLVFSFCVYQLLISLSVCLSLPLSLSLSLCLLMQFDVVYFILIRTFKCYIPLTVYIAYTRTLLSFVSAFICVFWLQANKDQCIVPL